MKITIVTAFHEREETTRIVCESLDRLAEQARPIGIELSAVGAYDGEHTDRFGSLLYATYRENHPISDRMNEACRLARDGEPDVVIFIGGDNVIDACYLNWVREQIDDGADVCGPLDCYFYRRLTGEQAYWPGYGGRRKGEPIGAGRAISRGVLDAVGWTPWPPGIDQNLDGAMWARIRPFVQTVRAVRLRDIGGVVLDIKDETGNINDWHHIHAHSKMEPRKIPCLDTLIGPRGPNGYRPKPWFSGLPGPCLAMIARVRDGTELAALERALYSAAQVCTDAFVVVDASSCVEADRLLLDAGAEILRRRWTDDFSAARNVVHEYRDNSKWLVVLDADEELEASPDIFELMARDDLDGIGMEVHIATDEGLVVQRRSIRAYRPGVARWERRVHNQLVGVRVAQQSGGKVFTSYRGVMAERAERQLPVLMEDLARDPHDPHTLKYLVRALYTLGHYEHAEQIAVRLLALAGGDPRYSDVYLHLASLARKRGDFGRVFMLLVEGAQKHPGNPEIWRHLIGICLMGWVGHADRPSEYDGASRLIVPDLAERAMAAAATLMLPVSFRAPAGETE